MTMNEENVPGKNLEAECFDTGGMEFHDFHDELNYFIPLAFCRVDFSNLVDFCSQVFRDISGYKEEEIIGSPIFSFFKDQDELKSLIDWSDSERVVKERYLDLITKDGKEIPMKVSIGAVFDKKGTLSGYFLTALEMTDRKEFEEELERKIEERTKEIEEAKERLQESEKILEIRVQARTRQLKELAESMRAKAKERMSALEEKTKELEKRADMEEKSRVALLNLAEDLEDASQKAREEKEKTMAIVNNFTDGLIFFDRHWKLKMINPQSSKIFNISPDEVFGKNIKELKGLNDNLNETIKVAEKSVQGVLREELEFDEDTFMEVSTVSVHYDDESMGTLIIVHDITREKNIEKMKTDFVSLAAHQLRTPLAGIKWTLRAVSEEVDESGASPDINDFVLKAYEANERMINLVNDLLNVTRIEEGRYVYEAEEINIKDVVDLALEEYRDIVETHGLKLVVNEPEESLPSIRADKEELTLVLKNFLDNSIKYTKEGEISLGMESLDNGAKVKLTVSDTGVGVPEEHKDKMFDKFSRAENVQKMDTEGSGLGLFISKNIVEAHKGEIGFESEEGKGSSFFFTIPTLREGSDEHE